jgi:DNA polymerase (family 10)
MDNRTIAKRLLGQAHQLEARRENLYRIRAYRRAAEVVLGLDRPVDEIVGTSGRAGLKELPGIGSSLSATIETLVRTGDIATLKDEDRSPVEG